MSQEKVNQIMALFNDGNRYLNSDHYNEAVNSYIMALYGVRHKDIINSKSKFGGSYGVVEAKEFEGMILHSLSIACMYLGNITKSKCYKKEAISIFETIGAYSKANRVKQELEVLG